MLDFYGTFVRAGMYLNHSLKLVIKVGHESAGNIFLKKDAMTHIHDNIPKSHKAGKMSKIIS